jgi:hypothetical protein
MAVKEVVKTEYHTDDGSVFEDKLSADKHDLAVSAGTTTAAVEAQAAILTSFHTADLDAAFESAVAGGPVLPTEDAIRRLAALFLFARRPAAVRPATAVTGEAVGALADNLSKLNAAPAPEPEVAPEAPKPDIFAHNR